MVCVSGVHSVAVGMHKTNMFLVEQQLNEEKVCNQVEVINTNVTEHIVVCIRQFHDYYQLL